MRQQQSECRFEQRIKNSKILEGLETLEAELNEYKQSKIIRNERYTVRLKLNQVKNTMANLRNELDDLLHLVEEWEVLE